MTGEAAAGLYFVSASKLGSGTIAGIVVAVAAAVLSAGAAFFFYRRWKAAVAIQQDLYRAYTLQRRPPDSAGLTPTGFSSSLETRSNASLLRNDTPAQAFAWRAQQPASNLTAQHRLSVPVALGSRDSQSVVVDTPNSPTPSAGDEVRRSCLLFCCNDVESLLRYYRVQDGGLFQKHPEVACH